MPQPDFEQLALQVNFTPSERRYFDKLKVELLALFEGKTYEDIYRDEDVGKLRRIDEKLKQIQEFIKTRKMSHIETNPEIMQWAGRVEEEVAVWEFRVFDRFVEGQILPSGVRISYLGNNFLQVFSSEPVISSLDLSVEYYNIKNDTADKVIIEELGGLTKVEMSLAEIWELLQQQRLDEPGALLTNGQKNIFYVRDTDGQLHVVHVYLTRSGWALDAEQPANISSWENCRRVFVRSQK